MTQDQIIQAFREYPKPIKSSVLRKLLKMFEDDLVDEAIDQADAAERELTIEERLAVVESLAGSVKMKNPPMTKEEEREFVNKRRSEKYK